MLNHKKLLKYGISDVKQIVHNPSYDLLFQEETKPRINGFEKGTLTNLGAINVMTGKFTGRCPKDKYIVEDTITKDSIWWNSPEAPNDNKPITQEIWNDLKSQAAQQLSGKSIFVLDTYCGAAENTR